MRLFELLGVAAHYTAFAVEDLAEALQLLSQTGFRGLSVTLPHKEEACRWATELDETARSIGAVNTLRRQGDHWEGRNTDWIGAVQALRQVTASAGQKRTGDRRRRFRPSGGLWFETGGSPGHCLQPHGAAWRGTRCGI